MRRNPLLMTRNFPTIDFSWAFSRSPMRLDCGLHLKATSKLHSALPSVGKHSVAISCKMQFTFLNVGLSHSEQNTWRPKVGIYLQRIKTSCIDFTMQSLAVLASHSTVNPFTPQKNRACKFARTRWRKKLTKICMGFEQDVINHKLVVSMPWKLGNVSL